MGGFVRGGGYIRLLALAAAELKLVHDDAQLMARLVVLRPLRVTQLAVDGDLGALDEVTYLVGSSCSWASRPAIPSLASRL